MTLRTVLLSLQALLASPEPDDPQDAVVARQCKEKPVIFQLTAQHWAHAYAGGTSLFLIISNIQFISFYLFYHNCHGRTNQQFRL